MTEPGPRPTNPRPRTERRIGPRFPDIASGEGKAGPLELYIGGTMTKKEQLHILRVIQGEIKYLIQRLDTGKIDN